jgi:hypothetical protein
MIKIPAKKVTQPIIFLKFIILFYQNQQKSKAPIFGAFDHF